MAAGRIVVGVVIALAGVVWTLQGLGFVGGSFMTGATIWAVIGPVTAGLPFLATYARSFAWRTNVRIVLGYSLALGRFRPGVLSLILVVTR